MDNNVLEKNKKIVPFFVLLLWHIVYRCSIAN